jgi:uncharacterized protein YyaL (SSP411 family)
MPNRLANETSPYLLQHAHNPVDWYPWSDEALERARREDRPILLSIGYSACHWCHVMERESFENPAIARLMNERFVNIKVDREERPDLDSLYMTAVQGMTGHGGWPMTVFLTPDGTPFFGGTYYPPADRGGMPGFPKILEAVATAYRERRAELLEQAAKIRDFIERNAQLRGRPTPLTPALLDAAFAGLRSSFDSREGGFGGAPKFPQPMGLELLLRICLRTEDPRARSMVALTLDKMARGGMYDQLGGGFHRYSVDAVWLVPHFEKMLYDNAQLALVYLHAFQVTGEQAYRRVCEETLDYVRREMTSPDGGFYATQDADSEGEEGKFFVWTPEEITAALCDEDARLFLAYYGVRPGGNFEGHSILFVPRPAAEVASQLGVSLEQLEASLARSRRTLFDLREQRVKPGRDEKILTAWNGLMLRAFAEAGAALGRSDYLDTARDNAEFVLSRLRQDGRLLRTYKDGQARLNGYLEDYACYADGLLALYQATLEPRWLHEAGTLAATMLERFWDDRLSGFYDTSSDHEQLVSRPRDVSDNATPAGNSVAVEVLLRLGVLLGEERYRERARQVLESLAEPMERLPLGFGRLLCALDTYLAPSQEVAIIGEPDAADTGELLAVIRDGYRPYTALAQAAGPADPLAQEVPFLADRPRKDGKATAYVCRDYTCSLPTDDPAELARQLASA